jgi:hypothetical protein
MLSHLFLCLKFNVIDCRNESVLFKFFEYGLIQSNEFVIIQISLKNQQHKVPIQRDVI